MSTPVVKSVEPLDVPSGLLLTEPPSRAIRWAGGLLVALAVCAAFFAATFPLPDTVVASFELVPMEGEDPLQATAAGELVAVRAQEGGTVRAGDELFLLRSDEIRNAHSLRRQLLEDTRALEERVRRLDEAHLAELAIKDAEIVQGERELVFRGQHLATIRDLLNRAERLATDGLISQVELLRHQLDAAESEKDRVLTEKLLQQIRLQRQERVTARERQRNDEHAEAEKRRLQLAALDEQLVDSSGDRKSIRAPYDAVVLRVTHRNPGSMVTSGAVLAELARSGSKPVARLFLPESGVPKILVGQKTRLYLSAFPYQRHGTVAAVVRWTSPAPVAVAGESRFIALAELGTTGGSSLPVRVGMQGEARILVGRQTLLQRALEPLRAIRERSFQE